MRCTDLIVNKQKVFGKERQCVILFLHEGISIDHLTPSSPPIYSSLALSMHPLLTHGMPIIFAAWALEIV